MNSTVAKAPSKRGLLLLLLLLFFAPLIISFVVYYGSNWRPGGRTNHGVLIEPARPLPAVALQRVDLIGNADNGPAAADTLNGKWSLLFIGDGECSPACVQALHFMHQTHLSLGSLIPRVQRVWLAPQHCCTHAADPEDAPALIALSAQGAAGAQLLAQFPGDRRDSSIFIVDPRGNLMMRYDVGADPKGLREDLKKLLNLSHIG
jgi:cytochrome oxidase Cu insertion factor (SCO1/SenC/PrrC family)